MATKKLRDYNCKDEELPVIGKFVSFSFKRDQSDFQGYSPKFAMPFITSFDEKIEEVKELVAPHSEMVQQKVITERLYATMRGLSDPTSRLGGYVDMAFPELRLSLTDFGITALRKSLNTKDPESVMQSIREVLRNTSTYGEVLSTQGLTEDLVSRMADGYSSIESDVQERYEITSNRKNIIQANIGTFNDLYSILGEILYVGKILYQFTNAAKEKEYTFSQLMKSVRRTSTPLVPPIVEEGIIETAAIA